MNERTIKRIDLYKKWAVAVFASAMFLVALMSHLISSYMPLSFKPEYFIDQMNILAMALNLIAAVFVSNDISTLISNYMNDDQVKRDDLVRDMLFRAWGLLFATILTKSAKGTALIKTNYIALSTLTMLIFTSLAYILIFTKKNRATVDNKELIHFFMLFVAGVFILPSVARVNRLTWVILTIYAIIVVTKDIIKEDMDIFISLMISSVSLLFVKGLFSPKIHVTLMNLLIVAAVGIMSLAIPAYLPKEANRQVSMYSAYAMAAIYTVMTLLISIT